MISEVKTTTKITRHSKTTIDNVDIVDFLRSKNVIPELDPSATIKVYVTIPGGCDWSHANLEIDRHCPVTVEWIEESEEYE